MAAIAAKLVHAARLAAAIDAGGLPADMEQPRFV
tara:strand:+ start:58 stop:159 length:102 start_codon:yes stop_codon:yes gene_type:complete